MSAPPLLAAKKSTRAFAWFVVCFLILPVTIIIPVSLTNLVPLTNDEFGTRQFLYPQVPEPGALLTISAVGFLGARRRGSRCSSR